jgi:ferredoxin
VFAVEAVKVERGKETDPEEPGAYKLWAPYRDKCIMCNDCLEVCPVSALAITLPQEVKS